MSISDEWYVFGLEYSQTKTTYPLINYWTWVSIVEQLPGMINGRHIQN